MFVQPVLRAPYQHFAEAAFGLAEVDETVLGALNIFLCWSQQGRESQLEHGGKINRSRIHFTLHLPGTLSNVCVTWRQDQANRKVSIFRKIFLSEQSGL